MKKIAIIAFLISLGFILIAQSTFAAPIPLNIPIGDKTSVDDLGDYIRIFYEFFVTSAGILAAAMMVIGGYKWITAAGNPSIISGAKEQIMSAIFGLVLALTSFFILNTLNPSITALTPLTIPVVQELIDSTTASRVCDFDAEIDEIKHEPIRCQSSKVITVETGDKCAGLWSSDSDNFCMIETLPGSNPLVRATEKKELVMQNHPYASQTKFDVKDDQRDTLIPNGGKKCGDVYWGSTGLTGGAFMVGSACDNTPIPGGADQDERCVMDGKFGNFTPDDSLCPLIIPFLNYQHDNGADISGSDIRSGCGKVTNMRCAI